MPNNPTYFALLEACAQPGCPVCRLEQQAVERYLDHLLYESVNDGSTRTHLRASLGFCRAHAAYLLDVGLSDALGMSIIYHDVFGTVLKRLRRQSPSSSDGSTLARLLGRVPEELASSLKRIRQAVSPHEPCLACQQRDNAVDIVLSVLADQIHDPQMLAAFTNSDGLCFPHLRQVCTHVQDGNVLVEILQVEVEKIEGLHTELAEFIRKSDYRYLEDGFGPEGNAWRRAARLASGGKIEAR